MSKDASSQLKFDLETTVSSITEPMVCQNDDSNVIFTSNDDFQEGYL